MLLISCNDTASESNKKFEKFTEYLFIRMLSQFNVHFSITLSLG